MRWLRNYYKIINLIREGAAVAPELQCVITISTHLFAKCSPIFSSVNNVPSQAEKKSVACPYHDYNDLTCLFRPYPLLILLRRSSLPSLSPYPHPPRPHTHSDIEQTFQMIYLPHNIKNDMFATYSPMHMICLPNQMISLLSTRTESHILAPVSSLMSQRQQRFINCSKWLNR